MKRQLKGNLYYLTSYISFSLSVFWIILVSLLLLSVLLDLLIFKEGSQIAFNLSFPIYVFAAVIGQMTVKGTVPYLIKMGSTRKNMYIGIGIYFLGIAIANALIANTLHYVVMAFYKLGGNESMIKEEGSITFSDGQESFTFNHLADFLQNTWMTRVIVDTSVMLFLLAIGFILGLLFYRYGLFGGFGFLGLLLFTFIIGMTKGWLLEFFTTLFSDFSIVFFYQLLGTGLVLYLLSFLLLRKITIK